MSKLRAGQLEQVKDFICNTDGMISCAASGNYSLIASEFEQDYESDFTVSDTEVKRAIKELLETDI